MRVDQHAVLKGLYPRVDATALNTEGRTSMRKKRSDIKFEYRFYAFDEDYFDEGLKKIEGFFTPVGKDGWELFTILSSHREEGPFHLAVFKREYTGTEPLLNLDVN